MTTRHRLLPACAALVLLGWSVAFGASGAAERATPSGLPVPRYLSLKFDTVNARTGPGDDYKLVSVYHTRGLPMQVVAETSEWRRVCDPEGAMVWIHKRTTDGRRTVINLQPRPVALLRRPKPTARVVAYLNSRAIAALSRCEDGYCKVKVAGFRGWARRGDLWGTLDAQQCR
jgi:SH3-like domain-containing protein